MHYFRGCASFVAQYVYDRTFNLSSSDSGLFQRVFFRSKTRHPTVHPFCCWLRLQSGFYALSFSFPWPNKYSVFFHFYSVNLAHLPFRLGWQEGVLIHHRINFPRLAISHLLFESRTDRHLRGRPTQESQRIAHRSSGVTTVEHPQPLNHYISFTLSV